MAFSVPKISGQSPNFASTPTLPPVLCHFASGPGPPSYQTGKNRLASVASACPGSNRARTSAGASAAGGRAA